ncbi:L,D-transpeptidase family protein [Microbacterium halophytorum]|uniref:L,D-transpeptidase family protein n=1 Tax=Microbacterium halophytorum TaxID=2067568 RepID=UPI00131A3DF4|nr:L,D-transpeptidase family protein [Microbacterium halophytorum]
MTNEGTTPIDEVEVTDLTADQPRRKRRTGLWLGIGIPSALVVAAVIGASTILIAPGVAVAGTSVGFHTAGQAAAAIEERVADATIEIGGTEVTGEELGAEVNAKEAAEQAFRDHPLWKVTDWHPEDPYAPTVTIDNEQAAETLKAKIPDLFVEPVDAQVVFEGGAFTPVAAEAGSGPDLDALAEDLSAALVNGDGGITVEATDVDIAPTTSTDAAKKQAKALNGMAEKAGFYVGDERAVAVTPEQIGAWLEVIPDGEGGFAVAADENAIQKTVASLPEKVDREAVDAEQIVDSQGFVISGGEGQDGWKLKTTEGVAADFAAALEKGEATEKLDVEVVEADVTQKERSLEVDLSAQQAYAIENGEVVKSFTISSGLPGHETDQGHFRISSKLEIQDMSSPDPEGTPYLQPDVPWVMYFNQDEGFHGAYWHNNFGSPASHGCVNMTPSEAKWLYDWSPIHYDENGYGYGLEVWVHA